MWANKLFYVYKKNLRGEILIILCIQEDALFL